jgi:hypothetical protein
MPIYRHHRFPVRFPYAGMTRFRPALTKPWRSQAGGIAFAGWDLNPQVSYQLLSRIAILLLSIQKLQILARHPYFNVCFRHDYQDSFFMARSFSHACVRDLFLIKCSYFINIKLLAQTFVPVCILTV